MTIASLDNYIAATKQLLTWYKAVTRTTVAYYPFTMFDVAGNPGAGASNPSNTANGVLPVDTDNGYPVINSFGGNPGYLSKVDFGNNAVCRLLLFDRLFWAGAYTYNTDTSLSSQPSFSSRVPNTDYKGLELWVEAVTAFTGTPSFQINYLDQDGNAGDTGVVSAPAALTLGRCFQLPLAAGDTGIQRVDRVRCTVATAGIFNVAVLRRLWSGRIYAGGDNHDLLRSGLVRVYDTSALHVLVIADSTGSGYPDLQIEIASG
jgi:hypothetical protein